MMEVYFRVIEGQTPDPQWDERIGQVSRKFKQIKEKAANWAGGKSARRATPRRRPEVRRLVSWMRYALMDTALGAFGLAWTERGVARVALPGPDARMTEMWISRDPAEPGFPEGALAGLPERIRRYARASTSTFQMFRSISSSPRIQPRLLRRTAQDRLWRNHDLWRNCAHSWRRRAVTRGRPGDGGESHSTHHSLPSRAGRRRPDRRLLLSGRRNRQNADAGARTRCEPERPIRFRLLNLLPAFEAFELRQRFDDAIGNRLDA